MSDDPQTAQTENDPNPSAAEGATSDPGGETALAQITQERDQYLNLLQRTQAELVNYRKRAQAQAESDRLYAISNLAADILHVLDNFERALEAARASGASSIAEGLDLVYKQLLGTLAKHGVEPIESVGQPFDPNMHEALTQLPDPEHPEGTVVKEFGKGYRIKDRVLRPSRVAVSVRPSE